MRTLLEVRGFFRGDIKAAELGTAAYTLVSVYSVAKVAAIVSILYFAFVGLLTFAD